jgi:hypothetical protein
MTLTQAPATVQAIISAFPTPGRQVLLAYRDLNLAVNGNADQKKQVGNPALLPRPWEPATCREAALRAEVWAWLEDVVVWLNHEYTWDVATMIPTCWVRHPHLVHEIAAVADQRRRAGLALTSDALEEWHRYCLPAFIDRLRTRLKAHCEDEHVPWPGRSRHNQFVSQRDIEQREQAYAADVRTLRPPEPPRIPRLGLVDLDTGEVQEIDDDTDDLGER